MKAGDRREVEVCRARPEQDWRLVERGGRPFRVPPASNIGVFLLTDAATVDTDRLKPLLGLNVGKHSPRLVFSLGGKPTARPPGAGRKVQYRVVAADAVGKNAKEVRTAERS